MKHVKFKSTDRNYHNEYYGEKNNTVRTIDMNDERFKLLETLKHFDGDKLEDCVIEIEHVDSKETFCRIISNVTFWDDVVIITWHKVVY